MRARAMRCGTVCRSSCGTPTSRRACERTRVLSAGSTSSCLLWTSTPAPKASRCSSIRDLEEGWLRRTKPLWHCRTAAAMGLRRRSGRGMAVRGGGAGVARLDTTKSLWLCIRLSLLPLARPLLVFGFSFSYCPIALKQRAPATPATAARSLRRTLQRFCLTSRSASPVGFVVHEQVAAVQPSLGAAHIHVA